MEHAYLLPSQLRWYVMRDVACAYYVVELHFELSSSLLYTELYRRRCDWHWYMLCDSFFGCVAYDCKNAVRKAVSCAFVFWVIYGPLFGTSVC